MTRLHLFLAGSMLTLAASLPVAAQSAVRAAKETATSDSAIYAAFFETLNRQPRRDTIFVAEQSIVFQGISAHYDSVAPGLAASLVAASAPARASESLHLPPPIVIISPKTPQSLRERALNGTPTQQQSAAQGTRGVWSFSPVVYSRDGKDAMFYYSLACGQMCGEQTIVWARKDAKGVWGIRRTAILVIS